MYLVHSEQSDSAPFMNPFHLMLLYIRGRRQKDKSAEYTQADIQRALAIWRRRLIAFLLVLLLLALGGLAYVWAHGGARF